LRNPFAYDKKAAEAAYSLHVLIFIRRLFLSLFGNTPELLKFIHLWVGAVKW
jgi:hypothetical protein